MHETLAVPDELVTSSLEVGAALADIQRGGVAVAICTYKRPASLARLLDSLALQAPRPLQVIVVDASLDDATERVVRAREDLGELAETFSYYRVAGALRGLTRQRNFALQHVQADLVAFFDDDVVLLPGCLSALEDVHRRLGDEVAGVGAFVCDVHVPPEPRALWRLRWVLRILPSLKPGRYYRSGMQTSWDLMQPTDGLVEGDWLQGCAMMWKTAQARAEGFNDLFSGYSNGEDLEFSLRLRRYGRLFVAGQAKLRHLHDSGGRPDAFEMGYKSLRNAYYIHQTCLNKRSARDVAWFLYAYIVDSAVRFANNRLRRRPNLDTWLFLRGRLHFLLELLANRGRIFAKQPAAR